MKRILLFLLFGIICFPQAVCAQSPANSPIPPDSEIRKILKQRLDENHETVGIIVGIIEPAGRRFITYGSLGKNDNRSLDENTVFEIGSITKVFTALLLADMARNGEVALNDSVEKYLPKGVTMPKRSSRVITLEDLSKHRSALPRMPTNFDSRADPQNPYPHYSLQLLYEFISSYKLPRNIGAKFEYSNIGAGLLGHALSLAAGKDYETLIQTRICAPLGMHSTAILLSPEMKSRLAVGHNSSFKSTPNWDFTAAFAGAGALRSTADDMLSFLAAQVKLEPSDLSPAIDATLADRTEAGTGMEIGLGWLMRKKKESEIIWHNGGTGGYRAFAGFDPKARVGVVALTNVSTPAGVDDLGFHLLDPESKLLPPDSPLLQKPWQDREITLDSADLDSYAGKYLLESIGTITVTREESRLYIQVVNQSRLEMVAESKREFFIIAEEVKITFESDGKGPATALILHQGGQDFRATRIAE